MNIFATESDALSVTDALFAKILESSAPAIQRRFDLVEVWWQDCRDQFQSIVEFLEANKLLESGARRTLEMAEKGYLKLDSIEAILKADALERISNYYKKTVETRLTNARVSSGPKTTTYQAKSISSAPALGQEAPEKSLYDPRKNLPNIGDFVGKCQITEQVGRGSSSAVYRAIHRNLQMTVAVKLLLPNLSAGQQQAIDFSSEARALAKFSHQNIIRILDFDEWNDIPYLVLEHIDGVTLEELIDQVGNIQPKRALEIVTAVARGLKHANENGFCHRDVKPANILIGRNGTIKLADLGLARVVTDCKTPIIEQSQSHKICGTPSFMSPEQINGEHPVTERSDIYSLGATLFAALTGRSPFIADQTIDVLLAHLNQPAPDPRDFNPNLPSAVAHLVMTMLEKDPSCRFQNYTQLLEALDYVEKIISKPADIETGKFLRDKSQIFRDSERLSLKLAKQKAYDSEPTMSGEVSQMGIEQIVQFLNWTHKTGYLRINYGRWSAGIAFENGEIYHCWFDDIVGLRAFTKIASSSSGRFEFFDNQSAKQRTIQCSTMSLLMNAAKDRDETVYD